MRSYHLMLLVPWLFLAPSLALADAADDFISLGEKVRQQVRNPYLEDAAKALSCAGEEVRLSEAVCQSPELLNKVFLAASRLPLDLIHVLLQRIRFRIHQENQTDLLQFVPEEFVHLVHSGTVVTVAPASPPEAKKPDLTKGSWEQAPDGRTFWVSEENPDFILSPAEYQRLLAADPE